LGARRDSVFAWVGGQPNAAYFERRDSGLCNGDAGGRIGAGAVGVSSFGELPVVVILGTARLVSEPAEKMKHCGCLPSTL